MKLDKPITIEYTDFEIRNVGVQGNEMIVDFRLTDCDCRHEVANSVVLRNTETSAWRGKRRLVETRTAFTDGMVARSYGEEAFCAHLLAAGYVGAPTEADVAADAAEVEAKRVALAEAIARAEAEKAARIEAERVAAEEAAAKEAARIEAALVAESAIAPAEIVTDPEPIPEEK